MGRKKHPVASAARRKSQGYREELDEIVAEFEKLRSRLEKALQDPELIRSILPELDNVLFEVPLANLSCAVCVRPAKPNWTFTKREKSILQILKGGFADREIGDSLGISEHTVHDRIKRLLARTGLRSRLLLVQLPLRDLL